MLRDSTGGAVNFTSEGFCCRPKGCDEHQVCGRNAQPQRASPNSKCRRMVLAAKQSLSHSLKSNLVARVWNFGINYNYLNLFIFMNSTDYIEKHNYNTPVEIFSKMEK
jgi:hypothetical protein